MTLTILRPLGDASTAITIDGPSLRFRLTRPPGAGSTATFCRASGTLDASMIRVSCTWTRLYSRPCLLTWLNKCSQCLEQQNPCEAQASARDTAFLAECSSTCMSSPIMFHNICRCQSWLAERQSLYHPLMVTGMQRAASANGGPACHAVHFQLLMREATNAAAPEPALSIFVGGAILLLPSSTVQA